MGTNYIPPLAVNFIWNCSDGGVVDPIIDVVRMSFARDKDRPFSRGLNIPLFYFSSKNPNEVPNSVPYSRAQRNIIFVFTSTNTLGRKNWEEYINALPNSDAINIVPVAIDKNGLGHKGSLAGLNCIRVYDWPERNTDLHAVISLAHEIYRFGCAMTDRKEAGKSFSLNLFLSHAKAGDTGRLHSEEIKKFIDNTNMNSFFDTTDISPGFRFGEDIEKSIQESTFIAIESDAYSSRYWCQREILCAKKNNRPLIVVDSLNDYEDRIFPAASNVPCVHVPSSSPIEQRDILRILLVAILETIRHNYSLNCLEYYRAIGWIDNDCELTARPPEIRQAINIQQAGKTKICYPEPPLYSDEADWHQHFNLKTSTPLWSASEKDCLSQQRIGISISEFHGDGFSSHNLHPDHVIRLAQDLSRHLLARSATLIYGGDLRPDGFTEFILDESAILKERLLEDFPKVENHLAWPLYVSAPEIVSWRARYIEVMKTIEHDIPRDVAEGLARCDYLPPNTLGNSYIWSRCLTEMRERSIEGSSVRVCAGGRLHGYKGKMPGVLEEVILAIQLRKPLFLLGAFGGVVGEVCSMLLTSQVPEALTEAWQISHNEGYADLQKIANQHGYGCDYDSVVETLKNLDLENLASSCGLSKSEYEIIMCSPFIDECLHLILKGIRNLSGSGQ